MSAHHLSVVTVTQQRNNSQSYSIIHSLAIWLPLVHTTRERVGHSHNILLCMDVYVCVLYMEMIVHYRIYNEPEGNKEHWVLSVGSAQQQHNNTAEGEREHHSNNDMHGSAGRG